MAFSFTHRKLLLPLNNNTNTNIINPTVQTCLYFCNKLKNDTVPHTGFCPTTCLTICPSTCHYSILPQNINNLPSQLSKSHNLSPLLISMLILLASVFLLITFYAIYTKLYYQFYHFTPNPNPNHTSHGNNGEGTMVFHPIWYIPTVGLNPTVINSIKVHKYEEDQVEGVKESDCAVCLGEFNVGDDLRILPKCKHAFHVPCIDTWLRSHVTCPLCRAPIDPSVDGKDGLTREFSTTVTIGEDEPPPRQEAVTVDINNNDDDNNNDNDSMEDCVEGNNNNNNNNNNSKEKDLENNKRGSCSQRWSWEGGAASLVSRSLSCSGKIFLSRYNNRPSPNSV